MKFIIVSQTGILSDILIFYQKKKSLQKVGGLYLEREREAEDIQKGAKWRGTQCWKEVGSTVLRLQCLETWGKSECYVTRHLILSSLSVRGYKGGP